MLMRFVQKHVLRNFFNKMLLTYTTITVLVLAMLVLIVARSVSSMLLDKEINFNKQVIQSVTYYIEQRHVIVQEVVQQLYTDKYSALEVFDFLERDLNKATSDYTEKKVRVDNHFMSNFSLHSDIDSILLYKQSNGFLYAYSRTNITAFDESSYDYRRLFPELTENDYGPRMVSPATFNVLNLDPNRIYSYSTNIKSPNDYDNLGVLTISFKSANIAKAYANYKKDLKGSILILNAAGFVLFDSSQKYSGKSYPYFSKLKTASKLQLDEKSMVNIDMTPNSSGVIVAGIIPLREIYSDISLFQRTIYIISFFCIIGAILLMITSMKVFSKRVRAITQGIASLQQGDFSKRIPVHRPPDEISQIATSFNKMYEKLGEYIEKVYITEIQQKNAELKALQAQINPHFLYNTLESIRMRALTVNGNEEISEMIYRLGIFFRNIMRSHETFVKVGDELHYCQIYLELHQIKYGDKLDFQLLVDKKLHKYSIIKLLFQPILENCFKHGFTINRFLYKLSIEASELKDDNALLIIIRDNGKGIRPEDLEDIRRRLENDHSPHDEAIGLLNVNSRIRLNYGKKYGAAISSEWGEGTTVRLKIPAISMKEVSDFVQGDSRR